MSGKAIATLSGLGVLLFGAIIGGFVFFEKIDNGYVGVQYSMNGGIQNEALTQGVKFVGLNKVTQYPIRLQTITAKDVSVSTKDGKKTKVDIKYDYKIDPRKTTSMFKEFGNISSEDIEQGWLKSKLQKDAREVYAQYDVLSLLSGKSSEVEGKLAKQFADSVEKKGFLIEDITVSVPDIDNATRETIDGIIRAGQENEKAKLDAATEKTKAETEASKKTLSAQAEADAIRLKAEAQADANKKIGESVTQGLIDYETAQARKAQGWVTVNGASTVVKDDNK